MLRSGSRLISRVAKSKPVAPSLQISARFMADSPIAVTRKVVPVDPTENERDIILVVNPATKEYEPVVLVAPERSFEWVHSSPVDTHTFEIMPVVKDSVGANGEFDYEDY